MMGRGLMKALFLLAAVLLFSLSPAPLLAKLGDAEKGEVICAKRCLQCHGEEGDGLGPAAECLNPPPRDFTLGLFKIISSAFDADLTNDDDLFRMVRDGMPGTAMPGWSDLLSDDNMWNVIAYIKTFAELEGEPEGQVDYGTQVKSSPESIAAGKKLFHADDRCSECHGAEGKGSYKDGTWRVVMISPLTTSEEDKDLQFVEGRFILIAFFAWDGSNSEAGSQHAMTTWYWLLLKPSIVSRPMIAGILAALLIGALLIWWGRGAAASRLPPSTPCLS